MSVSAKDVKELRETTGAGMMDCKKALAESNGDKQAAIDYLRKKGLAAVAKKQSRVAAEGIIGVAVEGENGVLVEVNCETDFVAKNADFSKFVGELSSYLVSSSAQTVEDLKNESMNGTTIADHLTNLTLKIGEKIDIRRFSKSHVAGGTLGSYIHDGKIGVLVALKTDKPSAPEVAELGKDLSMHVAASDTRFISPDEIDESFKNREAEIYAAQLRDQGKPENMIENIVKGKLNKLASEVCLLKQKFVKDPDQAVEKVIAEAASKAGATIEVTGFSKLVLGEGIEKKEDNLAEEVAKISGN